MNIFSNHVNRSQRRSAVVSVFALIALVFLTTRCEEYDAPPDVEIKQPVGGAFLQGETIRLNFSEPIDTSTLFVSIWPTERGTMRVSRKPELKPLIESCKPTGDACGDLTLTVDKDGKWVDVLVDGELGIPGLPLVLEIHSGLSDKQGNETGVSRFFDFQYRLAECGEATDLQFDDGLYILSATVNEPMTAVLTLVSHMRALPDGNFALAGAKGQVVGDGPKNDTDPTKLKVTDDKSGFALFAKGCISVQKNGKRLLETEPVDVELPVLNLFLKLYQVRIFGEVKTNPETGKDRIDGTLSYEKLQLINKGTGKVQDYDAASTATIADFVPETVELSGHPELCGNLCGVIQGVCEPPADFPDEAFCP